MCPPNISRRNLLKAAVGIAVFSFTAGCVSQPTKSGPIELDVSKIKDIPSLIAEMKSAAGSAWPNGFKNEDLYPKLAEIFVKNAKAAYEQGYKIPQWVLDRLPQQKKVVLAVAALPLLGVAEFSVGAVAFTVPVSTIITAIIASIVVMTGSIIMAIKSVLT